MENNTSTQNTEPPAAGSTKPGKLWLWGLAVFQLLAVVVMTIVGIEETVTKLCGFAILLLCGSMDIKALKKAGYQVFRWWWALAVFLPPVYMICRVCKTDKAPSERVKRFAPVLVWVLLLGLLMGLMGWIAAQDEMIQEMNLQSLKKESLLTMVGDCFAFGPELTVDEVLDVDMGSLERPSAFPQKWQAAVKISTAKGRPASAILRYDFERTADGLEYSVTPADEAKLQELQTMAQE